MMRRPLALAALLVLAGCGSLSEKLPSPAANRDSAITVTREQDGRFLSFVGPKAQHDPPFLGVPGTNVYLLRGWLDTKSGETANQLYVEDSYYGPKREWNAVSDAAGQNLRFISIRSDEITCENGCAYAEEFAAALPETLLRASTKGLSITFTAKSGGHMTITVPGARIADQLAAIDSARAGIAPKPSARR
jgi:hypothetical protein